METVEIPQQHPVATPSPWARSTTAFGTIVFLASDIMLFGAFFAAWFLLRSINDPWVPAGLDLDVVRALVFTVVLVSSSATMALAERAYERGDLRGLRRYTLVTLGLGAAFLANQIVEYAQLEFGIDSHVFGSAYWMLTGLHAAHVTAGLAALALLFVRAARVRHSAAIAPWVSATSLFWHLVDVVWIFVFLTIWVLQ